MPVSVNPPPPSPPEPVVKSNDRSKDNDQFLEVFTPLKIVQPLAWLGIISVSVGAIGTLVWSVFGSVRESVTLKGVVAHPDGLVQVFSPATERIHSINVEPGDSVTEGQIIARLSSLSQDELIKTSLKDFEITKRNNEALINLSNRRLLEVINIANQLDSVYQPLAEEAERLYSDRLITATVLAQSKKNYLENKLSLLTEKSQLQSEIKTLNEQITEKEGTLNENSSVLEQKYVIKSPINGIVRDINYIRGEYPSLGTPLATISKSKNAELIVLATASSGDADKLIPGDKVLFTPSNVTRNRYGGITGIVLSIDRRPVSTEYIVNFTGNQSIGEELAKDQHLYLVKIKLSRSENSPTGFAWSSGSGPQLRQKPYPSLLGTTTIYYDEKRPISYVLPFLRGLVGLSDNEKGS